ncbi:hypothetical protein AB0399_23315 [Streptomyces sp. NPDC088194]|uniref:hypothetical protein n=1 Tax=Streptomyces sp. NPDC088194 TaxID=3154931 RepID=UPI00344E18E0
MLVMIFTGPFVWFMGLLPSVSRTRAIFVHDFLAWAIVGVLAGHVRKAYQDPEAAPDMRTGFVSRSWEKRHHPRWVDELVELDELDELDEFDVADGGPAPPPVPRSRRRPPAQPRA